MKKIILLVFVTLFCCVGYSQAQTTKKMTRQEKKEAQKAMEQALFEEARQAIKIPKGKESQKGETFHTIHRQVLL